MSSVNAHDELPGQLLQNECPLEVISVEYVRKLPGIPVNAEVNTEAGPFYFCDCFDLAALSSNFVLLQQQWV